MGPGNQTSSNEFFLLGLTDEPSLQIPLFVFFLQVYIITLVGNIIIVTLILVSPQLKTPMYFLLCNLSFADMCYTSVITPNKLANFIVEEQSMPFLGCIAQLFSFVAIANIEDVLLVVMAYDRYVAICNPLRYQLIMNKRLCIALVGVAYVIGVLNASSNTGYLFMLDFCGSHRISHFYCGVPPLLKLSCSDTTLNEIVIFTFGSIVEVGSLVIIMTSYTYIISTILKIRSSEGQKKALSTCASHFVCVAMFYVPVLFMYFRPSSSYSMEQDRVASVFYTVIIPMLNPIVYSLRNKDVTGALRKLVYRVQGLRTIV